MQQSEHWLQFKGLALFSFLDAVYVKDKLRLFAINSFSHRTMLPAGIDRRTRPQNQ